MSELHRQRKIRERLARLSSPVRSFLGTGFAALDGALGGGLPRGAIVELFGSAGCGKTTLALQILASVQRQGLAGAWIDAEHSFDPTLAASLGCATENLPLLQPQSAEQALEIACKLVGSQGLDLLVVDSAAALVPELELRAAIGEAGQGLQGRVLASGLRRLAAAAARTATCILFVNQMRTRRDRSGEDVETSAGGAALKLHAAARIAINPVTRGRIRVRLLKNKAASAFGEAEMTWRPGTGFVESP
jgi:recombination protein RecA